MPPPWAGTGRGPTPEERAAWTSSRGKGRGGGPPEGKGWRKAGFKGVGPMGTPGQPAARDDTTGLLPEVAAVVAKRKKEANG